MESPLFEKIAEDGRGASWAIILPNGIELVLIYSVKGAVRGGHSHNKKEVSVVVSGGMKYLKRFPDNTEVEFEEGPLDVLKNAPDEIHLAEATSDGWLIDIRADERDDIVTTNYPPYRAKVDLWREQNE